MNLKIDDISPNVCYEGFRIQDTHTGLNPSLRKNNQSSRNFRNFAS